MKTVVARSAGGVVVDGDLRVALIGVLAHGDLRWQLPKGRIEEGETPPDAAVREVKEETGLTAEIVRPLQTIEYWFVADGTRIHKFVDYFLMRYVGGTISAADPIEVVDAKWLPGPEAVTACAFDNERAVITAAIGG